MKSYPITCPSCEGTGKTTKILNSQFNNIFEDCKPCNGTGVVTCFDYDGFNNPNITPYSEPVIWVSDKTAGTPMFNNQVKIC